MISSVGLQSSIQASATACRGATSQRSVALRAGRVEEIYIGFPKNDYAPRDGRKGRVIRDDPAKYPDRDALAGGWAGGEAGLWKFREAIKKELGQDAQKPVPKPKSSPRPIAGKAPIYVGFGKDELDLKNTGTKGRVVYDDEEKYPGKEDLAGLAGITGGFAGGELGVKNYAATGVVRLRKPGEPGGQPVSPLSIGFVLVLGGGVGGVVLSTAINSLLGI